MRSGSKLFRVGLYGGGVGLGAPPPGETEWEMDWESGEEPTVVGAPPSPSTPSTPDLAPNPFGPAPAPGVNTGTPSTPSTSSKPSGTDPGFIAGLFQTGADLVSGIINTVTGQPAAPAAPRYTLDPARARAIQSALQRGPVSSRTVQAPVYDPGVTGMSSSDIATIAGVAVVAGLGYYYFSKKGKKGKVK